MYLSDKKAGIPRPSFDHDELEVMLESFSKQVEEIVNESETTMVNSSGGRPVSGRCLRAIRSTTFHPLRR